MKNFIFVSSSIASLGVILLVSLFAFTTCSNGSTNKTNAGVKGFASGVITAKGSIFVNGIEYETDTSSIMVDNLSGSDSDLKVGMKVEVKGLIDTATGKGVADAVNYASSIEGTVDTGSINTTTGTFSVFGMPILTDPTTVYEGITGLTGITPLAETNRVEVSGISNGTAIAASRVEFKTATDDFKLWGTISSLTASTDGVFNLTLESGTIIAVTFTGTLDTGIIDSSIVKVEIATAPVGGAASTAANKIELKHELSIDEGDRVEVNGIVSNFVNGTPDTFVIDDVNVRATSDLTAGVANGLEIEVKGTMEGGVLIATELSISEDADIEIKGVSTGANASDGTVVINGVTVYATHDTIFFDDTDTPVALFGLNDLSSGNSLEVNAYYDTIAEHLVAVKIERHEADTEAVMNGIVSMINGTILTVNGLSIETTPLFGTTGLRDTFLSLLAANTTKVKFTGTISGTTVTWTAVEID